jgi:ADP-ribose pyrophosphatase YjhB (NUDIX family)
MKYRIIIVALIEKDNLILLGKKAPGRGPYPDTWHLPGGGVDLSSETCEEALRREVREETGLEVKEIEPVAWDTDVQDDRHGEETYYIFLQCRCKYAEGEIRPGDDMHFLEWIERGDLARFNLNPPTRKLLKNIKLSIYL